MRIRHAFPGLLLLLAPALVGRSEEIPHESVLGAIGALELKADEVLATAVAAPLERDPAWEPESAELRIALISSGVDVTLFPEPLRSQVALLGSAGDPVGYGTHAASVLFQLAPRAKVTSIGVYPNGRFHSGWQAGALQWAAQNARRLDVVLYAIPPSEFLDPVSASMAAGEWDRVADVIADRPLPGARGPVYGVSLWGHLRAQQVGALTYHERAAIERFAYLNGRWAQARDFVRKITEAGAAVVAPAGDVGPNLQTIFGVANFPEVTTVGGFDGRGISARSASGPGMDGRVKPDLVAPTGLNVALPPASELARALGALGLLDAGLRMEWPQAQPVTDARARPDSTFTAATVVAVGMGSLAASGIRDVALQRGALTAAAVPLPGVPVWRQGAGVLKRLPDREFLRSRPLALAHADLGLQPETGSWRTAIPFAQGRAQGASARLDDFAGVGPDLLPAFRAAAGGPPLSVEAGDRGVEVWVPLGTGHYEGGLYCGYTEVSVPVAGGTVEPRVRVHGIPEGTEQVPTCLVQGTALKGFNFYIHDINAEDLTLGLLPALPVGHSLLSKAMHLLPVDPLSTKLFFRVSGEVRHDARGRPYNLEFPNVPPGYYKVRQWSDYGTPIVQTVSDAGGTPVQQTADIGSNPAYQSFNAAVLSMACEDPVAEPVVHGESACTHAFSSPCSERWLKDHFGEDNVQPDKPTGGYLVQVGPAQFRVLFDYVKKMPGPAVSSRYIDLLKQSDFSYVSTDLTRHIPLGAQANAAAGANLFKAWNFRPGLGGERLVAEFNAVAANSGQRNQLGIARYPFSLSTPNYSAHMSLNFSYSMENAVVVVVVQMGDAVAIGALNPKGTFRLPEPLPGQPLPFPPLEVWGRGDGKANFEFHMLPRGASEGTLWLFFLPPPLVNGLVGPVSKAELADLSFELDTWTNDLWPAIANAEPGGAVQGHSFRFDSNYSVRQMSDPQCRGIDNGRHRAKVCEAWAVMVHSPGDDAATYNVVDVASGKSLMPALRAGGAALFDPARGVADFTFRLVHAAWSPLDVERVFGAFRTNGRFWEQLNVPEGILRQYPDRIEVRIADNEVGRASPLLEHHPGPVRVAPYVPFVSDAQFLDLGVNP